MNGAYVNCSFLLLVWLCLPCWIVALSSSPSTNAFVEAEVVGAAGRLGSLFLTPNAKAIPKGIAPGGWSPPNSPIYVTTPAKEWPQILQDTPPHRRDDLVWIGNGLPPDTSATVVVPHFGVLEVNADPVTSEQSPPTVLHGKHARAVEKILRERGIHRIQIVDTWPEIIAAAGLKLVWASSMWLLCHCPADQQGREPITALQVHTLRKNQLEALVRRELVPALNRRLPSNHPVDPDAALQYMWQYSQSMPGAIPSIDLARAEWKERNSFFWDVRDQIPQPIHRDLLQRVGGLSPEDLEPGNAEASQEDQKGSEHIKFEIPSLGFTVVGSTKQRSPAKTAIVVGAGILGSSVALHLARQGCQVKIVDAQSSEKTLGLTTPASWAWLNANGKSPMAYAWLNQLGMEGWRRDAALVHLPTWCGSLVCCREASKPGGYRCEGPLDDERLRQLEPAADWLLDNDNNKVYFYPEEGYVDPSQAVQKIREEAIKLGAEFHTGHNVTGFTRNDAGTVSGITAVTDKDVVQWPADVVVIAAGIGSANLAMIPLLHRPGQIAFARSASAKYHLQRILVDAVREAHVLQRRDGSLVVGGGALEVGGDGAVALTTTGPSRDYSTGGDTDKEHPLLALAQKLVPGVIGELTRKEQAIRPIPLDGLPAIGYIAPGLYCVVTHSGVTLAPILGGLAATEMTQGMGIPTLETYRPGRFFSPNF